MVIELQAISMAELNSHDYSLLYTCAATACMQKAFLFEVDRLKDASKLKNYREKYKRYYGIEFGSEYDVHHMDFDRGNSDIENLVLLPKELHKRYHFYLNAFYSQDLKSGALVIKTRIDEYEQEFYSKMLCGFLETLQECKKWLDTKRQMDAMRSERIGDV